MTQTNKIQICFIGAGAMAQEHIRAFQAIDGVQLAGIHSRTRAKAEDMAQIYGITHVCDSIPELYAQTQADLLVITVPELAANATAKAAFEHEWTVLMEKPAGYHLKDAQDIAKAAEAQKRRVYCALNRRLLSSTQAALKDLAENASPRYIYVQDQQSFATAEAIGHPQDVVDNWMYANSIHLVDYLRAFGRGDITKVTPVIPWQGKRTHTVLAKIEFSSGDIGIYEGIWNGPGPWAVTITTPERRWEMRPLEKAVYQNAGERSLNTVELHPWDEAFKPGFRLQAQAAIQAVRGEPHALPTLNHALDTMELIDRIFSET